MLRIEEAWKDLEAQAVVLAWAIPRVRKPDRTLDAARALAESVLDEAAEVEQYTCNVACDHGEECRTTRRVALRAKIEALGKEA